MGNALMAGGEWSPLETPNDRIRDLAAQWVKDTSATHSPRTIEGYLHCLTLLARYGVTRASELTRARLAKWIAARREEGVAPTTCNRNLAAVLSFAGWLERRGGFPLDQLAQLRRLRLRCPPPAPPKFLAEEELLRLREAARHVHSTFELAVMSQDLAGKLDRASERLRIYEGLSRRTLAGLELSEPEASLLCDALNGALLAHGSDYGVSPSVLYAEISDAISLNGLDRKWEVDGAALLSRMRTWGHVEATAVADAVVQFWARADEDSSTVLREVGLVSAVRRLG